MYLVIYHHESGRNIMKMDRNGLLDFLENFKENYKEDLNVTNILHGPAESISPPQVLITRWCPIEPEEEITTEWILTEVRR